MRPTDPPYPLSAIVGQDPLKRALAWNAVCPGLGGVLIAGDRGTAKSTAARGLAAVLPPIQVVRGCAFRCDPESPWADCPHCRASSTREAVEAPAPFVELPLGATEDRVAGSLDLGRTLRAGEPAFRPGLLASAHRGVLYIDEVNLLADHLVDLLLDAAAAGWHTVERDGMSIRHPARFVLVGSMNPSEGGLRPQLADRFGVRVEVRTPTNVSERSEVIRRRLAFDADPVAFAHHWADDERVSSHRIGTARRLFPTVDLSDDQVTRIAEACVDAGVEGVRADLAVGRAARAEAALDGRSTVSPDDLRSAAELVLPQRTRRPPNPPPSGSPPPDRFGDTPNGENVRTDGESIPPPIDPATVPRIALPLASGTPDRGRRGPIPVQPRGRATRTVPRDTGGGVAVAASVLAAARKTCDTQLTVTPDDLRYFAREDRRGALVLFVVDASGSMGARRRMEAVKAAALGMLADAERKRDDVAVIAVRGARAECLLPPTADPMVGERALARLPTGGRTPLAHGLALAADLARRSPRPVLLVVVSDGRANVPLPDADGDPWDQSLAVCGRFPASTTAVVIDADDGPAPGGRAGELARALAGRCLPLADLTPAALGGALGGEP